MSSSSPPNTSRTSTAGIELDRRRVKVAFIDESAILNLLNLEHSTGPLATWDYITVPHLEGLPADATVVGVNHDYLRAAWAVRIHSMGWEPVGEGQLIPIIELMASTIRVDRRYRQGDE